MPYIPDENREETTRSAGTTLNLCIEEIIAHLQSLDDDQKEGTCNYIISRIVAGGLKPPTGWRYMWLARAHQTFLAAAAEFYRRLLGPYEDRAIAKNGDIPEYADPFAEE
tara:strand:- start:1536 stop:1865 length:330 start_codon:yes stop_codon:yes gene_type:complete